MTGNRATNLQNRVTGNKRVMVLAMLLIVGVISRSDAGWPFNRTPAVEGIVTDATTGEPVEKVVVLCGWLKSVPSFGGDVTSSFTSEVCVTGKDGRYKIPAKTTFHLYSRFAFTRISFTHPLYETRREESGIGEWVSLDRAREIREGQKEGKFENIKVCGEEKELVAKDMVLIIIKPSKDGIVHADIRLMGLRDAIKREAEKYKKTGQGGFNFGSFMDTYGARFLTENWDREFVENAIKTWEKIANPDNGFEQDVLKRKKEEISRIYQEGKKK